MRFLGDKGIGGWYSEFTARMPAFEPHVLSLHRFRVAAKSHHDVALSLSDHRC